MSIACMPRAGALSYTSQECDLAHISSFATDHTLSAKGGDMHIFKAMLVRGKFSGSRLAYPLLLLLLMAIAWLSTT